MAFAKYYAKQQLTTKQTVYSCDEFKIGYGNNIGSICSPFLAKKFPQNSETIVRRPGINACWSPWPTIKHHHHHIKESPCLYCSKSKKMGTTWFISSFTLQSVDFFCQLTSISKSQDSAFQRTFINCILYFVATHELNLNSVQQARLPLQCAATQPPTAAAR